MTWIIAAASLIGVWLNIRKDRRCFAVWLATNATWAVVDLRAGLPAQAALMAVYAGLAACIEQAQRALQVHLDIAVRVGVRGTGHGARGEVVNDFAARDSPGEGIAVVKTGDSHVDLRHAGEELRCGPAHDGAHAPAVRVARE